MSGLKKKTLSAKFSYKENRERFYKLVLIALPAPYLPEPAMNPPIELAYIASFVKKVACIEAIDFATIDCNYSKTNYLKHIPLDGNMYVISCKTPQYGWLKQVSKYLKKFTLATTIAQGPHPTNLPRECLDCVDISIIGSGEVAVSMLIRGVPLEKIKGIAYLKNGEYYRTADMPRNKFNKLPLPDRDVFGMHKYKSAVEGKKAAHIITMCGCSYRCYICDKIRTKTVYFRSVENVMKEIDMLMGQGIEAFVIDDNIFTLGHKRVHEFCKEFRKRGIIWRCRSRADTVTLELLRTMACAGLANITYNIETGDTATLNRINKGRILAPNRNAILWSHLARVPVRCNLKYGLPGETVRSLKNTIKLMFKTYPDELNLSVFQPVPGSIVWKRPKKFGMTLNIEKLKSRNYLPINWFSGNGADDNWITLNTMTSEEYQQNLYWFMEQLDLVCRRTKIKDTL